MYWKLRIPLFLGVLGIISGLVQKFPDLFLMNTTYFIRSTIFIGLIFIVSVVLEITNINEKKVHFLVCMGIVVFGFTFDYLMV